MSCTYLNPHVVADLYLFWSMAAAFGQTYAIFRLHQMDLLLVLLSSQLWVVLVLQNLDFLFIPSVNPVSTPVTSKAYSGII
jgi:hypothetical protein